MLGGLGAILTLVTAVLFYFGWARSFAQARAMGIDVSLFGFSSQDYVLQSINYLYVPLLVLLGLGLGWLWLHSRVVALLRSDLLAVPRRRELVTSWAFWLTVAAGALAVGSVLFTVETGVPHPPAPVAGLMSRLQDSRWVVPAVLVAATLTASYASWIYRSVRPPPAEPVAPLPLWQTLLPVALVAGTVVFGGFWALGEFATAVGKGYAQNLANNVAGLPRAVVISPTPLGVEAPGVHEERVGGAGSPGVVYRTTGLRLLARSGGKILLVHDGWNLSSGTVIVVADREDLSWQFSK